MRNRSMTFGLIRVKPLGGCSGFWRRLATMVVCQRGAARSHRQLHPVGGRTVALFDDLAGTVGAGLVLALWRPHWHLFRPAGEISSRQPHRCIIALMLGFFVFMFVVGVPLRHFHLGTNDTGDGHPTSAPCLAIACIGRNAHR